MRFARLFGGSAALCAFAVAAFLYASVPARSFDLQSSPTTVKKPSADITDTYFFPSPTNPNNVVAVIDAYPSIPAGAGLTTFFDNSVLYTMRFDNKYRAESANGGRPIEDIVIQFSFSAASGGTQQVFVYGPSTPNEVGTSTTIVNGGNPSATGFVNRPFQATSTLGGVSDTISVFAGARRDPAFFNASRFFAIFPDRNQGSTAASCLTTGGCPQGFTPAAGSSNDFFANSNVLSIVVELPKALLTVGNGGACSTTCPVAYWATTSTQSGH